jgi:hypothetical protein
MIYLACLVLFDGSSVRLGWNLRGRSEGSSCVIFLKKGWRLLSIDPEKIIMLEQCQDLLREIIDRVYSERRAEVNGQKRKESEKRLTDISLPEDDVDEV